jgi:uncharacterized damage-inducible protein DinB
MPDAGNLLDVILDAWDRNNRILVNLARALPPGGLEVRATANSPTVAEMLTHMHYVRLVFLSEDMPETAPNLPAREWSGEVTKESIAAALEQSAAAVREAVENCIRSGQETKVHYDHPLFLLEHMIWHEGYHHGQIKLALKIAGLPLTNKEIGPLTWRVWMNKTARS